MVAQFQFLALILCLHLCSISYSQNIAITDKGDSVILFQDGTWTSIQTNRTTLVDSGVEIRNAKIDPFTGQKSAVTKTWMGIGKFDQGNLFGNVSVVDSIYAFNLGFTNFIGCLEKFKSTLQIKLSDGRIVELIQVSPSNCSSFPTATFIPIKKDENQSDEIKNYQYDQLNWLSNTEWVLIKMNSDTQEVLISPNKNEKIPGQTFFIKHLEALDYNKSK